MKAAQIVAVSEALVGVSHLPVAGGRHAVQQAAIVQHRQIEARAVPGNQVRRVLFQAVEEALDQVFLRRVLVSQAPHPERFPGAHDHRDCHDALLLMRQEFAAGFLPALGEHDLRDVLIGQIAQIIETPAQIGIGHGFNIEHQSVQVTARRMRIATATTRPASSVKVTCPSPMPSPSRTLAPRSEYTTSGLPQEFCTMPTSRIHTPCEKPVPMPLTMASLAANRMARNRTGRAVRSSCARSSGSSKCLMKRSPCFWYTRSTRSTCSTSMPMPKIMRSRVRSCAAHQRLHVAHGLGQAIDDGARDNRMADIEFDDFNDRGHGCDVVIIEPMTGVDGQPERGGELCRRAQALEFARP